MEKFIPYEKLSKKKKREQNNKKRGNWGALIPITRKIENAKAYKRRKARQWSCDDSLTCRFIWYRACEKSCVAIPGSFVFKRRREKAELNFPAAYIVAGSGRTDMRCTASAGGTPLGLQDAAGGV